MRPRRLGPQPEDWSLCLKQNLETGVIDWQELARLNFQKTMELIYRKNIPPLVEYETELG